MIMVIMYHPSDDNDEDEYDLDKNRDDCDDDEKLKLYHPDDPPGPRQPKAGQGLVIMMMTCTSSGL